MTPEEELELAELEELERLEAEEAAAAPPSPDQRQADQIAPLVDPNLSLPAQVLATQPATTHPQGDEAAQSDWAVKGTDAAKGTTIVYEPPLAKARKDLLENPQLLGALFPDEPITPEEIQAMDENSPLYKTYADHKWNEARWAAADSGTTVYRQSKMPWLHGESAGLSPISTLVTKLRASALPVLEGAQAFILGQDDSAHLGAIRRAQEATDSTTEDRPPKPQDGKEYNWHPTLGWTPKELGTARDTFVGGATAEGAGDISRTNEMIEEEHPRLKTAGQVVGLFTPDSVLCILGRGATVATKGAGALAARLGGGTVAQGAAKLAGAGAAAAVGGGAVQAGREGVEAGANLAKTGETGTTLGEATGRVQAAALDPVNLGLGVGGEAAGMVAGGVAKAIRDSPRYGGNIERVERLGGKIALGRGPVGNEATDRAIAAGKARDITPTAVMVEELAPKIAEAESAVATGNFAAAKQAKEAAKRSHAGFKSKFFASSEGQAVLPPVATMETNLKHLRNKMTTTPEGGLRPVGNAEGVATARAEFSGDVADVSLTPKPGAIELTPDEAEMFLVPALTNKLVPKRKGPPPAPPAPSGGPGSGAPPGVNKQGVNVLKPQSVVPVGEAPTVPPKGKAAKPAGVVGKPTIKTPPEYLEARDEYGRATADYRPAQQRDNARTAKLASEFEDPSWTAALESAGKKLIPGVALGSAAALATDDENAVGTAAGIGLLASMGRKPVNVKKILGFVNKRTAAAVKSLTPEEKKAITQWSSSSFHTKESYRRVGATPEQRRAKYQELGYEGAALEKAVSRAAPDSDVKAVEVMNSAIRKMAINNPTEYGTLYRGFSAGDQGYRMPMLDDILKKDTFINDTPISTSYNPQAVDDFAEKSLGGFSDAEGQAPVVLEFVTVKRAAPRVNKDIQTLSESARQREAEVIIPPGSTFRVVSREQVPMTLRGQKKGDPRYTKMATVVKVKQVTDAPVEAWQDAAMIGSMLGIGAATGDEDGGAMGAAVGGLALALKKRGVSKVYVTPRRYNAQQHEVRIGQLKDLTKDPKMPGAREAKERYAAALQDRGQRPLDGKPGGWSEVQQQVSDKLTALDERLLLAEKEATRKSAARRDAPGGTAASRLARYSKQRDNELPLKKEIEDAGARAGVTAELQNLRLLDPLEQLRGTQSYRGKVAPRSKMGLVGAAADAAALRLVYPTLNAAGSQLSPLRGGLLGTRTLQLKDDEKEAR